ncbi:hypothetical protein DBR43_02170 [Pedobacter sp. KBW06]|nr:hypothetical protein DBR43_02170 [Pedobacter sp. KBW06]
MSGLLRELLHRLFLPENWRISDFLPENWYISNSLPEKLSANKNIHLLFIPESLLKGKYSNVFKANGHFYLNNDCSIA